MTHSGPTDEEDARIAEVRHAAAVLAHKWHLDLGPPFPRSVHAVFAARMRDGTPCVLKLARPGTDWLRGEARTLELQGGVGAVKLLDTHEDGILLERAMPGDSLEQLFRPEDDDAATEAIAGVMVLWRRPFESDPGIRPVAALRQDLEAVAENIRRVPPSVADGFEGLTEKAMQVLDELVSSAPTSVLLHGDMHHGNVLTAGARGHLAIDPHGEIGDPGFDVGQLLLNPIDYVEALAPDEMASVTRRRLQLLSRLLGIDQDRLAAWGFVKAVISEAWTMEDGGAQAGVRRVAQLLFP